ncbi:lipoprotein [Streptomyces sp. XY152]|nr:lipoprotein [Streptomyces sp. XY152]
MRCGVLRAFEKEFPPVRTTAVRRTVLAATAAALALLVTACGGSGDEDEAGDGKGKGDSTASAAPAAKALTAAELEKAALAQADVKDGKVTEVSAAEDASADKVKSKDAACQPLAQLQMGVPAGTPAAAVKRSWTGEPQKPAGDVSPEEALLAGLDAEKMIVTLASYEDGGAEQVIKDVEAAAGTCAGGYAYDAMGEALKIVSVEKTEAPGGGDEAVAVTALMAADEGVKAPMKLVVARKGATVASFTVTNFASAATGEDFDFPTAVSDAQLGKLA